MLYGFVVVAAMSNLSLAKNCILYHVRIIKLIYSFITYLSFTDEVILRYNNLFTFI
jgi:hypothetical protein